MTVDRDRTCAILLALAVLAGTPQHCWAAELKRLPPVQPEGSTKSASSAASGSKPLSNSRQVTQSVWLQKEYSDSNSSSKNADREIQLVNWDDVAIVPPVQVEMETPGSELEPVVKPAKQPHMKLVSQQAPEAIKDLPALPTKQTVPPVPPADSATTLETQPTSPSAATKSSDAEPIQPGTPFVDDDCPCFTESECYSCCLPPCWYFQAEALMLFRSDARNIKIVENGTGAAVRGQRPALLTTDDLDPNPAWGPRFTLGHYLNDVHNLELVYFGMHTWTSQAAFNGINGVGFSFNNIDVPFDSNITSDFDGAQYISADYASKINNVEANLVTNNRWDLNTSTGFPWYHYADFLMGFRYFRLSEEFDLRSTDAGETSDYLIDVVNDLVGGQVGMVVGTYHSPRVSWNMAGKAGVYANFARQSTLMRDDNNTVLFRDFTTEGREIAFVGDFNFNLAYDIRPNMSVTAGYYLLYVGGVALAPEQLDFTTTPTSGSDINQDGGAFYHGPSVGLRINY